MKNQIELLELIFTQSWEDPMSDQKAVKIGPDKEIFAITSGGCNILNFLWYNPKKIYAVDINPVQRNVLDLKMTGMKHLTHSEYLGFLGLKEDNRRLEIYESIREDMNSESRLH